MGESPGRYNRITALQLEERAERPCCLGFLTSAATAQLFLDVCLKQRERLDSLRLENTLYLSNKWEVEA